MVEYFFIECFNWPTYISGTYHSQICDVPNKRGVAHKSGTFCGL